VPLKQLTIFVVLHTTNTLLPPVNGDPLILNPELSTFIRSQVPAAMITVLDSAAEPMIDPIIVLLTPVVT
jgi:hypothetical protein